MSWQNNNQHLGDWCRPTSMSATIVCPLSMMMVLILKVNEDIKLVDITREMNDKNFWGLCVCHNQNVSTVNDESHNGQRTDNSTDRATPDPPSFNSRHREKVFLCVSYPRRPMNKISTPSMARRHQIEKFTPTPFQPFQPSVWTGRAGGILICRFHKILLSRLFACYRAPCSLCFRKKGAIICSNCVTCTMGLFE